MEGSKAIGTHFEGVAARYLTTRGVDIRERNVYNRGGEIDLIGLDKDTLVFFEVRYRGSGSLVDPVSSISYPKQQRLLKAAAFYLHRHNLWNTLTRIDVVAISPGTVRKYRVQWIKNAIQADI
ncbi:YraN family protein [Marinobacter sp. ANT_B65]|uniref:YraN family protein n=1 Tax=Marinobacter sp. ANT_B65 TaxID=2039467 RepID=UPI000BBEC9F7|nr:YraN family protein [Marinobacter sp. ANT_B65]PCM43850.1 YraN family protein [Marinobacter sp. ANT_B65]